MKTLALMVGGVAALVALLGWVFSGPSAAEVDATHDAQCVKWGAKRGSSDYIQCRATLQVNYEREQNDNSNATAAGVALGMSAGMAAANSGVRR
ncbi:hypothetical protein [Burkholderia territorii]|uniref:hypothetical protein n=1 Tax=Burkholderia territorii TaxID=1503055 RepID=UPI0007599809|nr:hypothetical protein [Burkholderia territorii]KUZ35257.1 hypothetical protein WS52_04660 [Burkholderia territorii]KUZ46425.1 hypothetical protein WS53_27330 [Burkholderia territorii]